MRQVIGGLVYDQEKAVEIGSNDNIDGSNVSSLSDFEAWIETLCRTPNGNYFIAGKGGHFTSYAGKKRVTPLSRIEAMQWAERNLDTEEVEAEFNDLIGEA